MQSEKFADVLTFGIESFESASLRPLRYISVWGDYGPLYQPLGQKSSKETGQKDGTAKQQGPGGLRAGPEQQGLLLGAGAKVKCFIFGGRSVRGSGPSETADIGAVK